MEYSINNDIIKITLRGDYLGFDNDEAKTDLLNKIKKNQIGKVIVESSGLQSWDSTLLTFVIEILNVCKQRQVSLEYQNFPNNLTRLIDLALLVDRKPKVKKAEKLSFVEAIGNFGIEIVQAANKGCHFIGQTFSSIGRFFSRKAIMRQIDFLFALEDCSYKAIGIVSLVSFMVGLILAFVGAIQLKAFGAQIYVASLVAIGMTRIMGAIMVGIIMAGRTGASYAATIGTMQVNEEIDALKTMGIPTHDFLVLPRIIALTITIPMLTVLADFMGILGGAAVGVGMLDISITEYWNYSIDSLDMNNLLVGLFHALVFGIIISLCGCYYGINCGRNADSVGKATTQAVVSAIVWMIVATGFITLIFEVLGV